MLNSGHINYQQELERLRNLCTQPGIDSSELEQIIHALQQAGYHDDVVSVLHDALQSPEAQVDVGTLWVWSATAAHRWGLSRELNALLPRGEIGRRAVMAYALALGDARRARSLRALVQEHGPWLRESDQGWNAVAVAFGRCKQYWRVLRWTSDWNYRQQSSQEALYYRALALRRIGRTYQCDRVARAALKRPGIEEQVHDRLLLWTATEDALGTCTARASEALRALDSHRLTGSDARIYRLVRSMVEVQSMPRGERREALDHSLNRIAKAFHKVPIWKQDWPTHRCLHRTLLRLALDSRNVRPVMWGWWRFYGRVLMSALGILAGMLLLPFLGLVILYMPCCFIVIALLGYLAVKQRRGM